jgi:hypothetical protein
MLCKGEDNIRGSERRNVKSVDMRSRLTHLAAVLSWVNPPPITLISRISVINGVMLLPGLDTTGVGF